MNKPHKFFERHLDNNLDELKLYLQELNADIFNGKLLGISKEQAEKAHKTNSMATALNPYYNIFQFRNENIYKIFKAVREMTIEACEYYEIDYNSKKYYIQGWFNFDEGKTKDMGDQDLHDHSGDFHGYYCVNAEPSVTHYKIYENSITDNVNKNNRAVLSKTGYAHRKGGWDQNETRITIAYDMLPLDELKKQSKSLKEDDFQQHWIPLG